MNFAKRMSDSELVFADDYLDSDDPYGFYCAYEKCEIELMLKARRKTNLKSPYFAQRYPKYPHTSQCGTNIKVQKKTTNGIDKSIPVPEKNKLIFLNESESCVVQNCIKSMDKKDSRYDTHKQYHNRTASHLADIVRWHLQNPARGDSELEVPGCRYRKYKSVFQKIYAVPEKKYTGCHIFFGSLFFKKPFVEGENKIILNLFQKDAEPINLILNIKNWKDSQIRLTKNWINDALEEYKDGYKERAKNNKILPYAFFLGRADEDSGRSFYCDKHAAFYARAVENLYLVCDDSGVCRTAQARAPVIAFEDTITNGAESEQIEMPKLPLGESDKIATVEKPPSVQARENDTKSEIQPNKRKEPPFLKKIKNLFSSLFH